MARTSLAVAASLVLLVLRSPSPALAQVSDADRATARALAQEGQSALDKKDFATAVDRFERARQLMLAPTLALGLARAQAGLGQLIAAQETYNRILREGVPPHAPAAYAKAFVDARTELNALEPRIATVVITVQGAPSPRVLLDGAPLPAAVLGVSRPVDPGTHSVHAEADGFAPADGTFTVAERKSASLSLTLVPGASSGGGHSAGATNGRSTQATIGMVGIGVGGAGLLLGAIAGAMALGKHGELSEMCPGNVCVNQQSAIDGYHLTAGLSTAGFVVGGVFAAAGVTLLVIAPKRSSEAWLAPVVGPLYAGARGSF